MKGLDDDINVATVEPDGLVKVYDHIYRDDEPRTFLYSKSFPNYGAAKLWADEYEDAQRAARPIGRR